MENKEAASDAEDKPVTPMVGEKKPFLKANKHYALYSVVAVLAVLLLISLFTDKLDITGSAVAGDKAKLEFYVMSQCPYGTQVEDAIAPVLEKLGNAVDFSIDFIARDNGDGTFSALHGQPEVDENIRQLCAMKLSPENYMDYIICQNQDIRNAASTWEACASGAGLNVEAMRACSEGAEGRALHSASIKKADAAGASGSPTIYINGNAYNGGRDGLSFQREICKHAKWHPECGSMPECGSDAECALQPDKDGFCVAGACEYREPAQFDFLILNDVKCGAACDPSQFIAATRQMFKGINQRSIDVNSEEGQRLVSELGIQKAPAYLFSMEVTASAGYNSRMPDIASAFERRGEWLKLRDEVTGASYWIDEEARNEQLKALGITLGDNRPTLNLFVMSQCPYGVAAEQALMPVLELFGDKIDFQLDYIVNDNGDETFSSLHGQAEIDENIRQLCAKKLDAGKYLDYIMCQNEDYRNVGSNWERCALEAGIDKAALKACAEGSEGKSLLSASAKKAELFGASGSPTIVVEGQPYSGARTSSACQAALCSAFDAAPAECSAVLADTESAPAGGCGA